MKRAIMAGLALILLVSLYPATAGAEKPRVSADAAILMDKDTGQLLYTKNAFAKKHPASTTKVMTAIVTLENADLNQVVEVNKRAAMVNVGSTIDLQAGDRLLLKDLLRAALISSANDAAVAIAYHVGGTEKSFVSMMNRKAKLLGAFDTHFVNTNGYTNRRHYSTAYDLAVISRYAMTFPAFREIVATRETEIHWLNRERVMALVNTNRLLPWYPGANGIKTGTTRAAGGCLIASATRNGRELLAVVLDSYRRYSDAAALLDYGFSQFYKFNIKKGQVYREISIEGGKQERLPLVAGGEIQLNVSLKELPLLKRVIIIDRKPVAPVVEGEKMGRLIVYLRGLEVTSIDLLAGETVRAKPFWQRLWERLNNH